MQSFYLLLFFLFVGIGVPATARPLAAAPHAIGDLFKARKSHFGKGKPQRPLHKRVRHSKQRSLCRY